MRYAASPIHIRDLSHARIPSAATPMPAKRRHNPARISQTAFRQSGPPIPSSRRGYVRHATSSIRHPSRCSQSKATASGHARCEFANNASARPFHPDKPRCRVVDDVLPSTSTSIRRSKSIPIELTKRYFPRPRALRNHKPTTRSAQLVRSPSPIFSRRYQPVPPCRPSP